MATIESTVKIILEFDTSSAIASSQSFDTAVINSAEKQKKVINEVKNANDKQSEAKLKHLWEVAKIEDILEQAEIKAEDNKSKAKMKALWDIAKNEEILEKAKVESANRTAEAELKALWEIAMQEDLLEQERIKTAKKVEQAKLKAIEAEEKAELKKGRVLLSEEEKIAREKERIRIRVAARNEYLQDNASTVKQKESLALLEKQAGTSRWALINLNRTVSDAPFFFRSFEMGIVSVSNNLDPLIQSFVQAKQDSGSWSAALKGIGAQLMGTGGLMLAFGLVNAAITAFALSQDNAKESTEKQTKAIKEQKEALDSISSSYLSFTDPMSGRRFEFKSIEALKEAIRRTEEQIKKFKVYATNIKEEDTKGIFGGLNNASTKANIIKNIDDTNKKIQELQTTIDKLKSATPADEKQKKWAEGIIKQKEKELELLKSGANITKTKDKIEKESSYNLKFSLSTQETLLKNLKEMLQTAKSMNLMKESGALDFADLLKTDADSKSGSSKSDAIKEIKNLYDSMYADLLAKKLKFVLTEYEYDKWSTEQSRNDAIEKYNEQLKNRELTNEQHYNLLLENENTYRLELLEIDKKYLEKQKEIRAKADKTMRKMSLEELKKEEKEKLRIMREEYDGIAVIADAAAQTMRDSFLDAWKDVFGEANSMLEKFLANVASGIANIGYQYLSKSIFGGLMGLFGLGGGASLASIAGAAGKPVSQTTINLTLDGEVIDRRVITNFGNYQTTARNRRLT